MSGTDKPGEVYALIPKAMALIGAIEKSQENKYDHYKFRGIDNLYNALHGPLSELGLFIVPHEVKTVGTREVPTAKGGTQIETTMVVRYRIYGPDGSFVEAEAEGVGLDRGDKASNKAQTAAFKVLCFQCFLPPLEDGSDSEKDSPERAPRREPATVSTGPLADARRELQAWCRAHRDAAELRPDAISDGAFLGEVSAGLYGSEGANTVERVKALRETIEGGGVCLDTGKAK